MDRTRCFGPAAAMLCACMLATTPIGAASGSRGTPWPRHVIDDSSRGADGVRLGDVNGDGLPDIATGWEEGGITRVYVHPGHRAAQRRWPAVTVGRTPSVEDAVLVDLDSDGRTDVVTCCEGATRTVFVHWAPREREAYLDPDAWTTKPIPASRGRMMWMFCRPADIDGRCGSDLVAGGKGTECEIGWFESPEDARDMTAWKWHPLSPAGWIMSLVAVDMDADGDPDILASDRRGPSRGCRWLENPGPKNAASSGWKNHYLGGRDHEVMFLTMADLDGDGAEDVLAATRDNGLVVFRRASGQPGGWQTTAIAMPENVGTGKAVAVGDLNGDGKAEVVFSCENAKGEKSGVIALESSGTAHEGPWSAREISGPVGIKFDRVELVDLDGDGDLDVLACEESEPVGGKRRGLGVFWYENPVNYAATRAR